MKAKLLILGLFCWFGTFAQSVPNTTTFSLQDVTSVVTGIGSNDLVECFAHAVDAYFDPTYTGSKNSLYNFRNYTIPACTRPGGLTTSYFYSKVNGVSITNGASAIYYRDNFSCASTCEWVLGESAGSESDPVYDFNTADCTKIPDHYYVMETYIGGVWYGYAVYVSSGLLHYVPE